MNHPISHCLIGLLIMGYSFYAVYSGVAIGRGFTAEHRKEPLGFWFMIAIQLFAGTLILSYGIKGL